MYSKWLLGLFLLSTTFLTVKASTLPYASTVSVEIHNDSTRRAELDNYYFTLSKSVVEGDFEAYKAGYHDDAIVVFATGSNKTTVPISKALANWKQGFKNTKKGKQTDQVTFRFSQRIGDETTAHDTGIFHFTSIAKDGTVKSNSLIHFEMLLVKKGNAWLSTMEYQKAAATKEEWDLLE